MSQPLTPRQQQVLDLIRAAIAEQGYPPTRPELSAALGASSPNAAEQHLRVLQRKGYIELLPVARGIRLIPQGRKGSRVAPPLPAASSARLRGEEKEKAGVAPDLRTRPAANDTLLRLPLIGRVAAGAPILAQQSIEDEIALDPLLFHPTPDFLLRVHGDSMRDAGIHDGDFVAVRRTQEAANGQIVVARLGDDATVKTFERRDGRIRLLPANPDFSPIVVEGDLAIEGRVVGVIRRSLNRWP